MDDVIDEVMNGWIECKKPQTTLQSVLGPAGQFTSAQYFRAARKEGN